MAGYTPILRTIECAAEKLDAAQKLVADATELLATVKADDSDARSYDSFARYIHKQLDMLLDKMESAVASRVGE